MRRTRWIGRVGALVLCSLIVCGPVFGQVGRIELGEITSLALATNLLGDSPMRRFQVYLPPSYDSSMRRYPSIYVLHGYTGNEREQVASMRTSLNLLINQRQIGEMIAVFVNGSNRFGGSFYLSSPVIGDFETYLARDLAGLIDARYRTLPARESRGITGYSMGGWGAMHLALKLPDTFSVAVAQAGVYDAVEGFIDGLTRQLAATYPTNFTQFSRLPFPVDASAALYAGLAPNLNRPDLFTDYPYEKLNGQVTLIEPVRQRALAGDVQHGDLPRYVNQAIRLRGIRLVHGRADDVVPVSDARAFTNALTAAGVEFDYQEHAGGHIYRADLALPFLSAHLQGAELYITPPKLELTLEKSPHVTFLTQTNVQYAVESSASLESNWTEHAVVTGNGQSATVEVTIRSERQFWRIKASNVR